MQNDLNEKNLLSISEASSYLGVSIDTIRRWDKKGKLPSFRSPGGHRYFKKTDLDHVFGKKYERAEETKPRVRKQAVSSIKQVASVDLGSTLQNTEPTNSLEIKPASYEDIPPVPNTRNDSQKENQNPSEFYFPAIDFPVFQPPKKVIQIPMLTPIKVIQREDINIERNISIDKTKYHENAVFETKIEEKRKTILVPSPNTLNTSADKEMKEQKLTRDSKKDIKSQNMAATGALSSYKSYLIVSVTGVILTLILIYLYITLPQKPLSPIP